jgi:uncharacterized protein YkwD
MGVPCRFAAAAAAGLMLLAFCANASASPSCPTDELRPTAASARVSARALLCDVNMLRRQHGLRPLRWNRKLARGASRHARDMASRHYFAHDTPEGTGVFARLRRAGYRGRLVAENIGFGTNALSSPRAVASSWMDSAPHRKNLLDPALRDVGVGTAAGGLPGIDGGGQFYVVDFGAR